MIDILDPKYISIINKDKRLFLYKQKLVPSDELYEFNYCVTENHEDVKKTLDTILNSINHNVKFPNRIIMDKQIYLYRKKRKILEWKLFKAGVYTEDDTVIKIANDGIFVLLNASLDHNETIFLNDEEITISVNQSLVKLVKKDDIINLNASLSEEHILLIWFTLNYELSSETNNC